MTKKELIKAVSLETSIGQKDVTIVLDSILSTIAEELKSGNQIDLKDFGSFKVVEQSERKGRNPRTNEEIIIPPKKSVKFKSFKNLLNYKWV